MNAPNPFGWRNWLGSAARVVLMASLALYVAAKLIEAVWPVLVISAAIAIVICFAWVILSRRRSGW